MWNLKKTDSHKQDRLVNFRGGPGVEEMDEGSQRVQTSS